MRLISFFSVLFILFSLHAYAESETKLSKLDFSVLSHTLDVRFINITTTSQNGLLNNFGTSSGQEIFGFWTDLMVKDTYSIKNNTSKTVLLNGSFMLPPETVVLWTEVISYYGTGSAEYFLSGSMVARSLRMYDHTSLTPKINLSKVTSRIVPWNSPFESKSSMSELTIHQPAFGYAISFKAGETKNFTVYYKISTHKASPIQEFFAYRPHQFDSWIDGNNEVFVSVIHSANKPITFTVNWDKSLSDNQKLIGNKIQENVHVILKNTDDILTIVRETPFAYGSEAQLECQFWNSSQKYLGALDKNTNYLDIKIGNTTYMVYLSYDGEKIKKILPLPKDSICRAIQE